ncbi:zinc finger protein SNAI2 [Trichonephila clavata]|uniref:Zinc finger protein SNAI2 n=1 Tax=Trichonephila clavata TaxID=2740835 RepID=A0A8X6JFU5_TRICU|nr:zinc finger protein SNAI2 [Trichonephila clavata]
MYKKIFPLDSKGPFDLSVKPKKIEESEPEPEKKRSPSPEIPSPPSIIEFSPKIVTSYYQPLFRFEGPSLSIKASSHLQKPVASTIDNFRSTATWPKPMFLKVSILFYLIPHLLQRFSPLLDHI